MKKTPSEAGEPKAEEMKETAKQELSEGMAEKKKLTKTKKVMTSDGYMPKRKK